MKEDTDSQLQWFLGVDIAKLKANYSQVYTEMVTAIEDDCSRNSDCAFMRVYKLAYQIDKTKL